MLRMANHLHKVGAKGKKGSCNDSNIYLLMMQDAWNWPVWLCKLRVLTGEERDNGTNTWANGTVRFSIRVPLTDHFEIVTITGVPLHFLKSFSQKAFSKQSFILDGQTFADWGQLTVRTVLQIMFGSIISCAAPVVSSEKVKWRTRWTRTEYRPPQSVNQGYGYWQW